MQKQIVPIQIRLLAGGVAGLLGGLLFWLAVGLLFSPLLHLLISVGLGLLFGGLVGSKIETGGASLVWGELYGLLWWLVGYLTLIPLFLGDGLYWQASAMQPLFPLLLGQVIAFGATMGLSYYGLVKLCSLWWPFPSTPVPTSTHTQPIVAPRLQSILIGGVGGLIGGWFFLLGIQNGDFFPLVAGLIGGSGMAVGGALHFVIAIVIGVGFGLLFHRDIHGVGSAIVWGMVYGISWWMLGPMTLRPLLSNTLPNWSIGAAQAAFAPLMAHLVYGAMVGFIYAAVTKLWNTLFVDSDPLNRTRESGASRSLKGVLMGQVAGLVGGLLFTIVMVATNSLPRVASLIGGQSAVVGFLVHLLIAFIIGSSYGLLFHKAAYSYGSGLGWGLVYGLLWWVIGAGTLFFLLLRQPVDWSLAGTVARFPALVGHLFYGMGLGLTFQYLIRRYDTHAVRQTPDIHRHNTAGSPAAALWAVALLIGVLLPLILGTAV